MQATRTDGHPKLLLVETTDISVSSHLSGQLAYLADSGFRVAAACADTGLSAGISRREGVAVHSLPFERDPSVVKDFRALLFTYRLLRRLRPDIVNYGTPKASLLGAVAAFVARVPVRVYTCHGLRHETMKPVARRVYLSFERLIRLLSTRTVSVSDSVRVTAREAGLPDSVVLGAGSANGIDTEAFCPERSSVERGTSRATLDVAPEEYAIGFIGRVTVDKGINDLVRAFRLLAQDPSVGSRAIRLLLIGSREGWDQLEGDTREEIERNPNIVECGYQEVSAVLPALDCLCLPTYREGLPTVILEAFAAGVPVVATRVTGVVSIVTDEQTGLLVEAHSPESLAEALGRVATDTAEARSRAVDARALVEREFSSRAVWERWGSFYEECLVGGVPG